MTNYVGKKRKSSHVASTPLSKKPKFKKKNKTGGTKSVVASKGGSI